MSRFNDWFFGGRSPAYDKLVSMTIEKRDDIIHRIYPEILRYGQKPKIKDVFFCPMNERPDWCTSDLQTKFPTDPVCLKAAESHPYNFVYSSIGELRLPRVLELCPETYWAKQDYTPEEICARLNEVCESVELEGGFFSFHWGEICVKTSLDGKYIHSILPNYDHTICPLTSVLESYTVDWETKKICKDNNGSMIGLASIVFDFELTTQNEYIISDAETWRERDQDSNLRLVAKVEPKPTSWDIPHGKLKAFMDTLSKLHNPNNLPIAGIIPTFSKAPPETHKRLEKDNIFILRFTQRGEISDGVSPGQTQL